MYFKMNASSITQFQGHFISTLNRYFSLNSRILLRRITSIVCLMVTLGGAMLFGVMRGLAQQPSSEANTQSPVELTEKKIEDLLNVEVAAVYSASKTWQKVTDAPASVSVIKAEDIRKYGYRTLADILRSVRGFYVTDDRNYSYVGVRGFARPGDYNTRVLLLIDGQRLNDNIYDQATIGTDLPFDVDLIERIEVVRGPSSSLYGTSAFFGVINIITRRGRDVKNLEFSGELASYGSYKRRISYGNKWKNGLELLLSGTYYDSHGVKRLYYQEFDHPDTNNGIAENIDGDRAKNFYANLAFRNFTLNGLYGEREKTIPTAAYDTIFNDPRLRTTDRKGYVSLQYEKDLPKSLNILSRVSYNYYSYFGTYPYADEETNSYLTQDRSHGLWWNGELQARKRLWKRHQITIGTEIRNNRRQVQEYLQVDPYLSILDSRHTSRNAAVYVQDEFTISNKLLLNVGVRYDHHSQFRGTINPRVGLIYNPSRNSALKLLYGSAFRAPNDYEYFYTTDTSKFNPLLQPETIKTTEAVYEKYLASRLRLSVSGYLYQLKGLIDLKQDPLDGLIYSANVERVLAKGLEFELETRVFKGFEGRASYNLQSARPEGEKGLWTNSPRHLGKFNLSAPIVRQRLFTSLDVQYVSSRTSKSDAFVPAYWLANLSLFHRRIVKGLDVSFSIYNLFDKAYAEPAGSEHQQRLIYQNGRNMRLKINYHF